MGVTNHLLTGMILQVSGPKKNSWGLVARTPLVLRSPSRGKNGRRQFPMGGILAEGSTPEMPSFRDRGWRYTLEIPNDVSFLWLQIQGLLTIFCWKRPCDGKDFILIHLWHRWKRVSGQTLCTMTTDVQEENTNQRLNYACCSLLVHPNTSIFRLHNQGSEDAFPMAVKGCGLHAMSQNAITTVDYCSTLAPWYISTLDHAWIYVVYEVDICIDIYM